MGYDREGEGALAEGGMKGRPRVWTDEQADEVVRLVRVMSYRAVADKLDITLAMVQRILKARAAGGKA